MNDTLMMIRKHIFSLQPGEIFCTRDVLMHGERDKVDHALSKLVNTGVIRRLARGVFDVDQGQELPSVGEIAYAKAAAFARNIFIDTRRSARILCLAEGDDDTITYCTTSRSSKFETVHGTVHLRGVSARKVALMSSAIGMVIAALWFIGRDRLNSEQLRRATTILSNKQILNLRNSIALMPDWMAKHFPWYGRNHWYGTPDLFSKRTWFLGSHEEEDINDYPNADFFFLEAGSF